MKLMNEEQFYRKRESDLYCQFSTQELTEIAKAINELRVPGDNPKVLEIGCGSGEAIKRMANEFNIKNVIGMDICDVSINVCKSKGLNAIQGDIHDIPFEDDAFDFVYVQFVLEHTHDEQKAISECLRVAKRVVFIVGMGERPDADAIEEEKLQFLHKKRILTDEVLEDILKDIPSDKKKVIKDVVIYNYGDKTVKNYAVVIDRYDKKIEEVE